MGLRSKLRPPRPVEVDVPGDSMEMSLTDNGKLQKVPNDIDRCIVLSFSDPSSVNTWEPRVRNANANAAAVNSALETLFSS